MDSPSVKVLKETQNSVSMEVVLAQANSPVPSVVEHATLKNSPSLTQSDIDRKLKDAAERRRSYNHERQQSASMKLAKIEEVLSKKAELNAAFIQATKEALEHKLGTVEGNREAILKDLKDKVKERLDKIQEAQQSKENDELEQARQVKANLEERLSSATAKRELNIQMMVKRLQAHEENVAKVCAGHAEQLEELRRRIDQELAVVHERRMAELQKIVDAAKEEEKKVEAVRQKKESMSQSDAPESMEQN